MVGVNLKYGMLHRSEQCIYLLLSTNREHLTHFVESWPLLKSMASHETQELSKSPTVLHTVYLHQVLLFFPKLQKDILKSLHEGLEFMVQSFCFQTYVRFGKIFQNHEQTLIQSYIFC